MPVLINSANHIATLRELGARRNAPLRAMSTMKVGGDAEYLLTPKTREDMIVALQSCHDASVPFRILGKGSNVLIPDAGVPGLVIRNSSALTGIEIQRRSVRAGASASLQRLINEAGKAGLGGIEYLYSVPGNVGGAIFMNAGRGRYFKKSIGDVVRRVEYWHKGRVRTIHRWRCRFSYRHSIFQQMEGAVILSAVLKLDRCLPEESQTRVRERMDLVKDQQDNNAPNLGTVFRSGFENLEGIQGQTDGDAMFSVRTTNWILNQGQAKSENVMALVDYARQRHASAGLKEPELEWTIW